MHGKAPSVKDFKTLTKLGEGGFGTVTLVKLKSNNRLFALKTLRKSQYTRAEDLQRVLNESEAMKKVRHPFIMRMFGAWQDNTNFYLLLEFASGGDMFSAVETHNTFPEAWCTIYVAEIALALEHIHKLGFMYRDLKLENVLIAADGHIKLGDFGLAKRTEPEEDSSARTTPKGPKRSRNTIIGSCHSMAPEIFTDKHYGSTVDWWSLGVVFCEMLLGEAPLPALKGTDFKTILAQYASDDFMRPLAGPVSLGADELIRGLLTVRVEHRLTSVAALKQLQFFSRLDWDALVRLEVVAPLQPEAIEKSKNVTRPRTKSHELEVLETQFASFVHADAHQGDLENLDTTPTATCDAASRGDVQGLRQILTHAGDLAVGDYDRRTPIHLAASDGHLAAVRFLVEEARVEHSPEDRWGGTPLDDAKRQGHVAVVKYLESIGARGSIEIKLPGSMSPAEMCDLASSGNMEGLHAVLRSGGDLTCGDYDKRTPIHLAASDGQLTALRFLVEEARVEHSPQDRWGGTPLDDAKRHGHVAVVEYLESIGASGGSWDPASDLCNTAASGDVDKLRTLAMDRAFDVNKGDYDRRTPIHLAASEGQLEVVKLLVEELGAHVSPADRWQGTPLDDATRHGHVEVVHFLESKGAKPGCGSVLRSHELDELAVNATKSGLCVIL